MKTLSDVNVDIIAGHLSDIADLLIFTNTALAAIAVVLAIGVSLMVTWRK